MLGFIHYNREALVLTAALAQIQQAAADLTSFAPAAISVRGQLPES